MPAPSAARYLLAFVNGGQWGHLTVLVGAKHLAERAGGHFTAQAVDVDLLLFMLLAHEVLLSLGVQWPGGAWAGGRRVRGQARVGGEARECKANHHHLFRACSCAVAVQVSDFHSLFI